MGCLKVYVSKLGEGIESSVSKLPGLVAVASLYNEQLQVSCGILCSIKNPYTAFITKEPIFVDRYGNYFMVKAEWHGGV